MSARCFVCPGLAVALLPCVHPPTGAVVLIPVCEPCFGAIWTPELCVSVTVVEGGRAVTTRAVTDVMLQELRQTARGVC